MKYIIRRIIVGVAVALIVFLVKKNVFAKEISSVYNPFDTSNIVTVTNNDATAVFDITGAPWANWGVGTLHFNFSIIKVGGSATDPIVVPHQVSANNYICDISSNSVNNSTWTGNTYSANCNMSIGSTGLTRIVMDLTPNQQNTYSTYRITVSPLLTYENYDGPTSMSSTNSAINDTTNAINNQTQAINNQTNTITGNMNQINSNISSSTSQIIQNQNQNSKKELEAMQVCSKHDKNSIVLDSYYLNSSGIERPANGWGITSYIKIDNNSVIKSINNASQSNNGYFCFYNINKDLISCSSNSSIIVDSSIIIPNNSSYIRFSINKNYNVPQFEICKNGNQAVVESQQQLQNTILDTDISQADSDFDEYINNFTIDTHGVTQIVTAPLRLLQALLDTECSQFSIPLPFVDQDATLPCMTTIYQTYFGDFFTLYKFITDGVIAYWVAVNTFKKIKDFLDPTDDKVEVFNL